MCLAAKVDDQKPRVWWPDKFQPNKELPRVELEELFALVKQADEGHAHNAMFEYLIWNWIGSRRHGWPELPLEKLHDTMAVCAYHALPLTLAGAGKALGLDVQKSDAGHKLMLKMCKPRIPRKAEKAKNPNWMNEHYWHETPEQLYGLFDYCLQDVEAEYAIDMALRPLPEAERKVWLFDAECNLRGVQVDLEMAGAVTDTIAGFEQEKLKRFATVTGGKVSGPRAHVAFKNWVNEELGLSLPGIGKEIKLELLKQDGITDHVREAIEIAMSLGKASTAKFSAMKNLACTDGRVRGVAQYHGAATGRWAGRGIQTQNFPRSAYDEDEFFRAKQVFETRDHRILETLVGDPYFAASESLRPSLMAGEGKDLICADFSAIEGRGLAYLAGEEWVLDAYRKYDRGEGPDMYYINASLTLGKPVDQLTKKERDEIGKPGELGGGYGGGPNAIRNFMYGDHPLLNCTDQELREKIVTPWREARPNIVRFWKQLENAAFRAVKNPGDIYEYRGIRYCVARGFLLCCLPNGRLLHYYAPRIEPVETAWGDVKDQVTFWGMKVDGESTSKRWCKQSTYGGKLTENVVQAFCRDLLAEAMLRLEDAGYPIVLHIHDEAVAEVDEGWGSLEEFEKIMEIVPPWAEGMPIKAEGWRGKRYRK